MDHRAWLGKRGTLEMSAHKAHRASLDPRASLAKKAIQETSVNKVLLGCGALSGCRALSETSAHKAYRGSRDPKEWLVRKAIRGMSVHLVPIVVVLGVVVVVVAQ